MSCFVYLLVSWIESIRSVIQPIREDILNRKTLFSCSLREKKQDKYMAPFHLSLISRLIDGKVNANDKCCQANVKAAKARISISLISLYSTKIEEISSIACTVHRLVEGMPFF